MLHVIREAKLHSTRVLQLDTYQYKTNSNENNEINESKVMG